MPTPGQTRATIDSRLVGKLAAIAARQDAFYHAAVGADMHGTPIERRKYAQVLLSHTLVPSDGMALLPDRRMEHPSDQAETGADLGIPAVPTMETLEVHCYDGPQGVGYVVFASAVLGGRLWRRAINVGPETWREDGWRDVTPEGTPYMATSSRT